MKSIKTTLLLVMAICMLSSFSSGADKSKISNTINDLSRAAMNREWAANAFAQQAESLKKDAANITKLFYETAKARKQAFRIAAGKYMSAARLYATVMSNYDKAARSYNKAAKLCERIGDIEDKSNYLLKSEKARNNATDACRVAAGVCEGAAAVYNGDADDLHGAAYATQSAATWWEKLATR